MRSYANKEYIIHLFSGLSFYELYVRFWLCSNEFTNKLDHKLVCGGFFHVLIWYDIYIVIMRWIRSSGSNLMLAITVGWLIRCGGGGGGPQCSVRSVRVTSADLSQAARCPVCWRRQVTLAGCCQITCKAAVQCYSCSASSPPPLLCLQLYRCAGFLSHNY